MTCLSAGTPWRAILRCWRLELLLGPPDSGLGVLLRVNAIYIPLEFIFLTNAQCVIKAKVRFFFSGATSPSRMPLSWWTRNPTIPPVSPAQHVRSPLVRLTKTLSQDLYWASFPDGKFFTEPDGRFLCEHDYQQTREKCEHCKLPLLDRVRR